MRALTVPALTIHLAATALADLERLEGFLLDAGDPAALALFDFLMDGLDVLVRQPGIGRPLGGGLRELILHRGKSGYLALYRYLPDLDAVRVLRLRHQREAGYADDEV